MRWAAYWAPGVLLAGLVTAPSAIGVLEGGRVSAPAYLLRFVVAFVFSSVGVSMVAGLVESYLQHNAVAAARRPRRRREDASEEVTSASS